MKLTHDQVITFLLAISAMLILGRLIGEFFKKFGQPMVIGEILAGIILGQTILGHYSPETFQSLFPSGPVSIAMDGFTRVAVILLLFIAGTEVELGVVRQQGGKAISVSFFSIVIPFALGFLVPWFKPDFFGITEANKLIFSLFLGTALSITAMPVLARILMDLDLLKTPIGMLIISAAMVDDFVGWLFFSVLLTLIHNDINLFAVIKTIGYTTLFSLIMLTAGRYLFDKILPWINKKLSWPGGMLSLSIALCLLAASFTEYIGVHAIFGAFIYGVALGDSVHFTEKAKEILHQFVNNIFAPLFFVSIGLRINFAANFDLSLTLIVLIIAFAGKMAGGWLGARIMGIRSSKSLAIASCMNARGAMEIILGLLALEAGIITPSMFVSLVIMAMFTSITAGPMAKFWLKKRVDVALY